MKRLMSCLLLLCLSAGSLLAGGWDPEDDTFDPTIPSVNVGDATWLGDPSPFVYLPLQRTGYTYVQPTDWDGFDPSVQVSLMVPIQGAEKTASGTGMLMLNKSQSAEFIKAVTEAIQTVPKDKTQRIGIETGMKDADWALTFATDRGKRFLQLENRTKDNVDVYRFSVNAAKKLIGAIQHSIKKVKAKADN